MFEIAYCNLFCYTFFMNIGIVFLIVASIALVIGLVILVIAGITKVKAGHVKVVERAGEYYELLNSGTHYRHPLLYTVVGYYSLGLQSATIRLKHCDMDLSYRIIDPKQYHYSGHAFLIWISDNLDGETDYEKIRTDILNEASNTGIEIESLDIFAK